MFYLEVILSDELVDLLNLDVFLGLISLGLLLRPLKVVKIIEILFRS